MTHAELSFSIRMSASDSVQFDSKWSSPSLNTITLLESEGLELIVEEITLIDCTSLPSTKVIDLKVIRLVDD
jgi:hypothetical protein